MPMGREPGRILSLTDTVTGPCRSYIPSFELPGKDHCLNVFLPFWSEPRALIPDVINS